MTRSQTLTSTQSVSPAGRTLDPRTLLSVPGYLAICATVSGVLVWTYWSTLVGLNQDWQRNPNYSVGQLVPLAALYLLWHDRKELLGCRIQPCWWGLVLLVIAQAGRAYGLFYLFESAERYALVLSIVGLVLLIAGWQAFWRVKWILLFLFLMVPLPGRLHNFISGPLQSFATVGAVYTLELIGMTVTREGNVMVLNHEVQLAVAEACSGLRMLTAFVVVAFVLAYMVDRPAWQRTALVLSSVPVAILCNIVRLVVTAELFLVADSEFAERFFHDFAGLTMMPIAVLMLVGELALMSYVVVDESATVRPFKSG